LDGYKYLPVFGKNFATVRIDGLVLCGKSGGLAEGIRHVNAWFEANRVTRRMRGVNVSMAMSGAMRVIITRLVWGGDDTQVNEKPFSIEGVTADL
jgi:hypothetical protein